jgi:DNA polymerase-3 subunit gamma/tau
MTKMLYEEYRPGSWDYVVGHDKVKRGVQVMLKRGSLGGKAFWLSGPSGIGKTSIAYLIAGEVCDEGNFIEIDAGGMTPKDIDDLEKMIRSRAIGTKSGRAILVNEAHGCRQDTIRKLLVTLERIPGHVTWIFTTTDVGKEKLFKDIDAHPLLSRCVKFELKVEDYADKMILRAKEIAEIEGLGGATKAEFVDLAVACKFNFRDMLTEIEKGVMCRDDAVVVSGVGAGANDDAGGCVAGSASVAMDWASMMDEMLSA